MRPASWLLCVMALACGTGEPPARKALLASTAARSLVGTWDVSFVVDTAATPFRIRRPSGPVAGTVVFALDRSGPTNAGSFRGITHEGAYDLDFRPFGFTTRLSGPSVAVARVAARATRAGGDSLWIVLSPGSEQFPVSMRGIVSTDSATGTWTAEAFSAGGGSGRFSMRRHRDPR